MAVERVRNADEAPLRPDLLDRLDRVEATPNGSLEEHGDQVAVARPDLLADEDRQSRRVPGRDLAGRKGAVDPVMVGDRQVSQAATGGRSDDGPWRGQRVERRRGVDVEIQERPTTVAPVRPAVES